MPAELKWTKLEQTGESPKPRSGHTITQVSGGSGNSYMMYGGIVDAPAGQKIQPTTSIYKLVMQRGKAQWSKEVIEGEQPVARAQHVAVNPPKSESIFIYGGHASPTRRLNDCWWLDTKGGECKWRRCNGDKDVDPNQDSTIGAPAPRANCGYCFYNGKVYIFGGHGGLSYQRVAFNDIYSFDIETETWEKYEQMQNAQTPPPQGRGGNSIFVSDDKLYTFGGWNSETQFNNLMYFDFETKEWTDPDVNMSTPRWNHSSMLVEAIPSWKFFIFGGEATHFAEGTARSFGEVVNSAAVLDLSTFKWEFIKPESSAVMPSPREYSAMVYDKNQLVIFGGWNNGWLGDMYTLNVSKIVGPPYAITEIDPPLGQLSGGDTITIRGQGFRDNSTINVFFTCGTGPISEPTKLSMSKVAVYVDATTLTCETPDFTQFSPRFECVVQLQFSSEDLTTTWKPYTFFMNTRAVKSLCYGAGLLEDQCPNEPTSFLIQARNDNCENRKSGRDSFQVKICYDDDKSEVDAKIVDQNDGSYLVQYTSGREGKVNIKVEFKDDKGKFVEVRGSPYTACFVAGAPAANNQLSGVSLQKHLTNEILNLQTFLKETSQGAQIKDKDISDVKVLIGIQDKIEDVKVKNDEITLKLDQLEESLGMLTRQGLAKDKQIKDNKKLTDDWTNVKKLAKDMEKEIKPNIGSETQKNKNEIIKLEESLKMFSNNLKKRDFYKYDTGREMAIKKLEAVYDEIDEIEKKIEDLGFNAKKFKEGHLIEGCNKHVESVKAECQGMKILWDQISSLQMTFHSWLESKWPDTKPYDMEDDAKKIQKNVREMKVDKKSNTYVGCLEEIKKWLVFLPMIQELRDDAMRERHWDMIRKKVGNFADPNTLTLKDIFNLNLNKYAEDVLDTTEQAKQEAKMEKTLAKLTGIWKEVKFQFTPMKDSDVQLLRLSEEDFELLEENQLQVQSMSASRYVATFEEEIVTWQKKLGEVATIVVLSSEIQRTWSFLESLFMHSKEVQKELPEQSKQFVSIDAKVREILNDGFRIKLALDFCNQDYINDAFNKMQKELAVCEKALQDFMSSKQKAFPRFYFVASADLLDILSNGNNPAKIMKHMPKIFQAIDKLELKEVGGGGRPDATSMVSCVGVETVQFTKQLKLINNVEHYMEDVIGAMRTTLKEIGRDSLTRFQKLPKAEWLMQDPAQITLLINMLSWVDNVETALLAQATKADSLDVALTLQAQLLTDLILLVRTDLNSSERQKVMCLITMDAHSRDIIMKLRDEGVKQADEFQWQSQLKNYWDDNSKDFCFKIADAVLAYGYEYLGNGPRLVVTPLTDRIYVTATQALHLKMGCAPAGPAGTGKTETTKDLSSCLAKAIYVFNCSDQMNYSGMGGIFKGLASSGSWGCFDEFNRLLPSVLSVCSVQFKAVTDAIRYNNPDFTIEGETLTLDKSCGVFITMNPGYLGRAELPEGLKALFRPITVVVPDLELICENMLMAEGFTEAKLLAKKFTTLYFLCRDLLSKALHYDWGLRAIKSVLVVAGAFKRAEPNLPEQNLLMRALRDFNTPKIVADDLKIFMGLLGDLFPGIDPPRKRDAEFEQVIEAVTIEQGLYPDDQFILKVVQLKELLTIRHCVFVMGPPGSGKSSTWKTLGKAQTKNGAKTEIVDLNPKVVSTNELYGVVHPQTREWSDGLMSNKMRELSAKPDTLPKWIVLDGDLDANWIESMNSVMDDNKILTLASNERIKLLPHMRLLFEFRNLKFATPATVSRAGILFISDASGYQWRAYFDSWLASSKYPAERTTELKALFEKYIPKSFDHIKKSFKYLIPVTEISMIVSLCKLLESFYLSIKTEIKNNEYMFVFCCVWCLGAGFGERRFFNGWWRDTWKTVKFPSGGSIFDYYVDFESNQLLEWKRMDTTDIAAKIDTSKRISSYTVPTSDTIAISYIMKQFLSVKHSPMLIGAAGCGKTQITKGLLEELTAGDRSDYLSQTINFNYYTDSSLLQTILESQLEKKSGNNFGPKGKFTLIYFIDDLNMPALDKYETQNAIALIRQFKDYNHCYERSKWTLKNVQKTLYVAAMNPTAGSFTINERLQRHFWLASVTFPETNSLTTIFQVFLTKHFSKNYKSVVSELVPAIIKSTLAVHSFVEEKFKKSAIYFHYEFNVRHLTNVFQGILQAKPEAIKDYDNMVKLWVHELERIYGDRLVNAANLSVYRDFVNDHCKKTYTKANLGKFFQKENPEPLVFAQFVASIDDKLYDQFGSSEALSKRLQEALNEYNDINPVMDLVLFEDAMKHVCKIARIISADAGHALLVGVGGSGKQSLSRLASSVSQYSTVGIVISSSYGLGDLKVDLQNYYNKAGLKDEGLMFLFTEGQITNERFLVFINDLLSSGEIADLFDNETVDSIVNNLNSAVKSEGIVPNKDNNWKFFIDRVRKNLHMALCFSPVGDSFRNRARKFPALINCTVIDWFHPWPKDALTSVADKFLADVEMDDGVRESVIKFLPQSFEDVQKQCEEVLRLERRYIYTTPKSFLELIKLFKGMLTQKKGELEGQLDKYENGVVKIQTTQETVALLEIEIKEMAITVEQAKAEAQEQALIVGVEKKKVDEQNDIATVKSAEANKVAVEVTAKKESVQRDLDQAIPLVIKAEAALRGLSEKDFQMLKAMNNPPEMIKVTFTAVLNLYCGIDPIVPTDKKGRLKDEKPWGTSLKMMAKPAALLEQLMNFKNLVDIDKVPAQNFDAIRDTLANPEFTPENLANKSSAAKGLCDWIINITAYYDVVVSVEPKKLAVKEAEEQLATAMATKKEFEDLVADLQAKLKVLVDAYNDAMKKKEDAEATAERCTKRLGFATRLVSALGAEGERWAQSIITVGQLLQVVLGDVLMASSFVSYIGPFNKKNRDFIMKNKFATFFKVNKIPLSENSNPLTILTNEAEMAEWQNEKLPSDEVSLQNGAIMTNSERYSLIIDPQLQGITWLKQRLGDKNLQVTRLSNGKKMISCLEMAIESGKPVLIENLENSIDAVIQPVYGRAVIKRGKNYVIKMGDKELTLDPMFKLYMHTKLSNPHYPPEIQAECTLINFTVTEKGLEDQLLSLIVKKERPDLAAEKERLIQQQNSFKITLRDLEADLLQRLRDQKGDILDDIQLIENLEKSKATSTEIKQKVEIAKATSIQIDEASEQYRPAAERGALVYFMMIELTKIHSFYKFSLDSFVIVINRAIDIVAERMNPKKVVAEPVEGEEVAADAQPEEPEEEKEMTPRTLKIRVMALIDQITFEAFDYTRRGTFEKHKLIIATMLTLRINLRKKLILEDEVAALIKKDIPIDYDPQPTSLVSWMAETVWASVQGLKKVPIFKELPHNLENEALQWKKWYGEEKAESADLPKSQKDCSSFHKLLLLRALRPDRLQGALREYVRESLGNEFVEQPAFDMFKVYDVMQTKIPVLFVLFPGVDPTPGVEEVGATMGKSIEAKTFVNISMGQGQEDKAINALKAAGKNGTWIMVQNVHLMTDWMKRFESELEIVVENECHKDFRCFISSEPPPLPDQEIIPESILQNSIKVSNEAPTDLKANLRRALSKFPQAYYDRAKTHKEPEFKALIFGLCMFHSLILGRRKFGAIGWSKIYNFNDGDLTICGDVLHNYLSKYEKVPYQDLCYIYGEIMYGGHITDDLDRRTNNTYLQVLIRPAIMDNMQMTLSQGFRSPSPYRFDRDKYVEFVESQLPAETPQMFGLHPNAEIGYLTAAGEILFEQILQIQGGSSAGGVGAQDAVSQIIKDFLDKLNPEFNMHEVRDKGKKGEDADPDPFWIVCLQEVERMNLLIFTIKLSLTELQMGLSGQLNITDAMDELQKSLSMGFVPPGWAAVAYPSLKPLQLWFTDLLRRYIQLKEWTDIAITPACLWISGLFNPMSFLTAIMQKTARADKLPLDNIILRTDITNDDDPNSITKSPDTGAYISGFFVEGAKWEPGRGGEQGNLADQTLKDLNPPLPVMHVIAVTRDKRQTTGFYECPVYVTKTRGPTLVFKADLKMESDEVPISKWILSGVALVMSPE